MAGLDDERIEALAWKLREALGATGILRFDGMTLISKMQHYFKEFKYRIVTEAEIGGAEAQFVSETNTILVTNRCIASSSDFSKCETARARAVFTLAHEIAHYILKHKGVLNRTAVRAAYERSMRSYRRMETEADKFAAAFLAPSKLIDSEWTVEQIQESFGLSRKAAEIRCEEVQRLARAERCQTRELPPVVVEFLKEAKARGHTVNTKLDDV